METKASYITVGIFVLSFVLATVLFAMWVSRVDFSRDAALYHIYFEGSVTGLRVNERVYFHGLPIGTVREISVDPQRIENVKVLVNIQKPYLIREDARAFVEAQGLTGYTYIQIEGSSDDKPLLKAKTGDKYPVISSRQSSMETLLNAVPDIINKIDILVTRFNSLFNEDNQKNITIALDNLAVISNRLAKGTNSLDILIGETRTSLSSFKEAMDTLNTQVDSVGGELDLTLKRLRKSSMSFDRAALQIEKIIGENRDAIKDFTSMGMPEFTRFLSEARETVNQMTRVIKDFGRSPGNFLHKNSQEGYQIN